MRYGFCTNFASQAIDAVDYALVERIKKAGYDYVEFSLTLLEKLSDRQFDVLSDKMKRLQLRCDCCCDMFPKSIRVVGPETYPSIIESYLQRAFYRAARIGAQKIVLGSAFSRSLPEGYDIELGYGQMTKLIETEILPLCIKYGIPIMIEPIRSAACNFINTLTEGMILVDRVASPYVTLMADTIHMLSESEDPDHIREYFGSLNHVHISEIGRILPEEGFSREVENILKCLRIMEYDKTISFETKSGDIGKALILLKKVFAETAGGPSPKI